VTYPPLAKVWLRNLNKMEPIEILQEQKILLLFGGWSAERDISINSGKAVAGALIRNGINFTECDLTSEKQAKLLSTDYDLAFIALHGRGGGRWLHPRDS